MEWHPHPDVWLLMTALAVGYAGALVSWGPRHAPPGRPTATRAQKIFFFTGLAVLWVGADWPIHELAEDHLFSVHMVQHTLFSLVAPPLLLLGMPQWLLRVILRPAWLSSVWGFLTRPFIALLLFNAVIVITHWPLVVDASVRSEPLHLLVHTVLFVSSLVMWWPAIAPLPEMSRLSEPVKMLYLFLQSVVPTVPASFLTFADTAFYESYLAAPRIWALDALTDQRIAGLIMKIVGGLLLWLAIAILFFRWNAREQEGRVEEISWADFEQELEAWHLRSR